MSTGKFINFDLPYAKNGVTVPAGKQAEQICTEAQSLLGQGAAGVAITYSANYDQTQTINKVYADGGWDTGTNGANQAAVMYAMEQLMGSTYSNLQGKLHIAPITTMNGYVNPLIPWNDTVLMGLVKIDLAAIEKYITDGWDMLGWQNQKTVNNPTHPYAIGGGIATLPANVSAEIQSTLIGYSKKYPGGSVVAS